MKVLDNIEVIFLSKKEMQKEVRRSKFLGISGRVSSLESKKFKHIEESENYYDEYIEEEY